MSWTDLHSHLVPDVDDGSSSVEESVEAVERLLRAGVRTIVTTPHVSASFLERPDLADGHFSRIASEWDRVRSACREAGLDVGLGLGTEILLDLPRPDVGDPRCRLEGGRYVLVEFPHSLLPPGSEDALYHVGRQDAVPIVAHVERYNAGSNAASIWGEWRDAGAALQVNVASLVGKYGRRARENAWDLLARGWVDLLGSDHHARGPSWIREAIAALEERGAAQALEILYRENPTRALAGRDLRPVPPVEPEPERPGVLERLRRIVGGNE